MHTTSPTVWCVTSLPFTFKFDCSTHHARLKLFSLLCILMGSVKPFPDPRDGLLLGGIFSGLGGWEAAAGEEWTQVFAAEVDPHARKVFEANTGRAPEVGDILTAPASAAPFAHVYTVGALKTGCYASGVLSFVSVIVGIPFS